MKERLNKTEISGLKVSVQGLGQVGMHLCEYLHKAGAELFVTDIDQTLMGQAVNRFGVTPVEAELINDLDVDVYAPCALGATINKDTIDNFKCTIIAGSANNQLAENNFGMELKKRDILYAPDYAIIAGGGDSSMYPMSWKGITGNGHSARRREFMIHCQKFSIAPKRKIFQ